MQAAVITEIGTAPVKRSHPDPVRSPVGQEAGVTATIDGGLLRHAGRIVTGFSGTTASPEAIGLAYLEIAQYAQDGKLRLPIREYPLSSIHDAWTAQLHSPGAKIIILPDA